MTAWGNVPTWVAASVTSGTFIGGLLILRNQGQQLALIQKDATEQRNEREQSQARKISA